MGEEGDLDVVPAVGTRGTFWASGWMASPSMRTNFSCIIGGRVAGGCGASCFGTDGLDLFSSGSCSEEVLRK
jgi:hypothetical protein